MEVLSTSTLKRRRADGGFSLLEMLTVVAIIGIVAGLAIMSMDANYYQAVTFTHDQRNAQELVEICTSAQAAGLNFVVEGDIDTTISNIVTGGAPANGAFQGQVFALPHLSSDDIVGAEHYLTLNGTALLYHSERSP